MAHDVWRWCEGRQAFGRTVTVKIKFQDFRQITRSRSHQGVVDSHQLLRQASLDLVRSIYPPEKGIRLVGVTVSTSAPTAWCHRSFRWPRLWTPDEHVRRKAPIAPSGAALGPVPGVFDGHYHIQGPISQRLIQFAVGGSRALLRSRPIGAFSCAGRDRKALVGNGMALGGVRRIAGQMRSSTCVSRMLTLMMVEAAGRQEAANRPLLGGQVPRGRA
jgi:hypothetical protein